MNIEDSKHYLRTFENQLYDSVYLLYFSFDTDQDQYPDDVIRPLTRASILNSILLLESAANSLVDALDLPGQFYTDIEKLPVLSKYEFFLSKIKPKKTFDRGSAEVQGISELKSIRDFYVHPKVKTSRWNRIAENVWDTDYGVTNLLRFPRDPSRWGKEQAIVALRTINNFFNLYFLVWCEFSVDTVVDLLLSSEKADLEKPIGAAIDCVDGLNRAVTEFGINFEFIGKKV